MEEHPQEVKIYKRGELVATATHVRQVQVPMPDEDEPVTWTCFHMPRVNLERLYVFQILNRQPLSEIFNGGGVDIDGEMIEPIYYIHGLVETFRGNPSITAVALGKPDRPVDIKVFANRLPELYKRFSVLI